jgi:hypothetical protein
LDQFADVWLQLLLTHVRHRRGNWQVRGAV